MTTSASSSSHHEVQCGRPDAAKAKPADNSDDNDEPAPKAKATAKPADNSDDDDEPAPKAKVKATTKPADNSDDDSEVVTIHIDDDSYVCPQCGCIGNGCEYCLALGC